MNEPTADRDPFEVIAASFLARYRAGQRPSIEEYAARYPDVAEQIRALLPALVMVEEDLSIDHGSRADTGSTLTQPRHVLETLDRSIGSVPRVMLADTDPEQSDLTTTIPTSDAMPAPVEQGGRYQLFGEIARGGMGAVLKGRDPDLGRYLAVKVLLASHEDKPEMLRRFVEEAQIGGQLQHPGIVPVYELGAFADRRPYFTMKLVQGRTLSSLLVERQSPANDLPRFLSIFEYICQTVAYSHARGVIHRDLKPSNVMVGRFGEVQVMDWGLAKVLKEGGVADESPTQRAVEEGAVATVRSGSDVDESKAGSVLGTPAYMAPEQASGELERVDRRADVFGLGAILCEILTGQTAYTGRTLQEVYGKAMRGNTAEALSRLDGCGADAELIALAKDSLAIEPEDRPRDAKVVAERITAYLAGVQERVHAAERERAVAVAKAIEERRRRKVQLALAASVLALTTLGALSTTYYLQQRAQQARQRIEREAASDRVVSRADTLLKEASANPEDLTRWQVALAAVEQAEAARDQGAAPRLLALRTQIQAGLDAAQRDKTLLDRVVAIRAAEADDPDGSITDHDYAAAFRAAEIDFGSLKGAEAGAKIKARPPSVALALATALDDWADIFRTKGHVQRNWLALIEAARVADPDPWRNELRGLNNYSGHVAYLREARQTLAKTAKYEELGPISLQLLASALRTWGDSSGAESVLRRAQQRYPGDVWINHDLGRVLENSRPDEAIRFYTAARALRPEIAHELADALEKRRDLDESIAVHRDLDKLRPGDATILGCLGRLLKAKGLPKEASAALEAAEVAKHEMERLKPTVVASAHLKDVQRLAQQGKYEEVIAELRTVKRLDPIRRSSWPNPPGSPFWKGGLWVGGTLDEAIAEYSYLLGNAKNDQGKSDEAIAAYREAIRLNPELAKAYSALVLALKAHGRLDEAVATYREAIRLKPDNAEAHLYLAGILRALGDLAGSLAMLRTGHELGSKQPGWPYPSARWLAEAQRRAAMAQRLAAILKGEAAPKITPSAGPWLS